MTILFNDENDFGLITRKELKKDFWISFMDIHKKDHFCFDYVKDQSLIDFGFVLNGRMKKKILNSSSEQSEIFNVRGSGGIVFTPHTRGTIELPADVRLQICHVHISPECLNLMLMENLENISPEFRQILEGKNFDFMERGRLIPEAELCANQVMNFSDPGIPGKLYYEAKALELICLQLNWMYLRNNNPKSVFFTKSEKDKIYAAKEIIEKSSDFNLSALEISSNLGIGINKLNFGFKEVFGCTIAGCIKDCRLQKARMLLDRGDANVSEAAWNIGYTNVSHFSSAFKKKFGVLPGAYLINRKKRIVF